MKSLKSEWKYMVNGKFIIIIFLAPLIVSLVMGYVFSNNQINESNVAVIDEDNSAYSRQLFSSLDASQYLQIGAVFHSAIDPNMLFFNEKFIAVVYLPRG